MAVGRKGSLVSSLPICRQGNFLTVGSEAQAPVIVRLDHNHDHGVTIPRLPRAGGHAGAYVCCIRLREEGSEPGVS